MISVASCASSSVAAVVAAAADVDAPGGLDAAADGCAMLGGSAVATSA